MKILSAAMGFVLLLILTLLVTVWLFYGDIPAFEPEMAGFPFAESDDKASSRFQKIERAGSFQLMYTWQDYSLRSRRITFDVDKRHLEASEQEFGYFAQELENFVEERVRDSRVDMIIHLKKYTEHQIEQSGLSQYISIREIRPLSFNLCISIPPSQSPSLYQKAKEEFDRITLGLAQEQELYFKKIDKEITRNKKLFLESRGLRLEGDKIAVNYSQNVDWNRRRVRPVVRRIQDVAGNVSLNYFLALMLSFVQEIRYRVPPVEEGEKIILGFWPPLKVLVNNFGDCDSKGVTFASMWMNYKKYPLLLIKVPEHLFVGIAVPSLGREGAVINGLRYTLCEVTGKEKMPPGLISRYSRLYLESGRFRYEIID